MDASMSGEVCFVCEEPMSEADRLVVGDRAILLQASIRRQDHQRRAQLDSPRSCLSVHRACQDSYLDTQNDDSSDGLQQKASVGRAQSLRAAKSAAVERIKSDPALSVRTRSLSIDLYKFDFTTLCFVCGRPATETAHRKAVKHVNSDTVRTDILQVIENQPSNNKYVEDIYQRLKPVDDLTKVCGRYHSDCLARLYRYQNFVPKKVVAKSESPKGKSDQECDEKKENGSVIEIKKSRLA